MVKKKHSKESPKRGSAPPFILGREESIIGIEGWGWFIGHAAVSAAGALARSTVPETAKELLPGEPSWGATPAVPRLVILA
jgi:hypothetical protein